MGILYAGRNAEEIANGETTLKIIPRKPWTVEGICKLLNDGLAVYDLGYPEAGSIVSRETSGPRVVLADVVGATFTTGAYSGSSAKWAAKKSSHEATATQCGLKELPRRAKQPTRRFVAERYCGILRRTPALPFSAKEKAEINGRVRANLADEAVPLLVPNDVILREVPPGRCLFSEPAGPEVSEDMLVEFRTAFAEQYRAWIRGENPVLFLPLGVTLSVIPEPERVVQPPSTAGIRPTWEAESEPVNLTKASPGIALDVTAESAVKANATQSGVGNFVINNKTSHPLALSVNFDASGAATIDIKEKIV